MCHYLDLILAQFKGSSCLSCHKRWYAAVITNKRKFNDTIYSVYDLQYDDGDTEIDVHASYIRKDGET
jgi:hypothetical protein